MNDLISRAAAIDAIVSVTAFSDADYIKNLCQNPAKSEDWLGGIYDAISAVEGVNTVDAAPVVHGRWVYEYDDPIMIPCSVCGYQVFSYNDTHYCPNCGAKMDEGEQL